VSGGDDARLALERFARFRERPEMRELSSQYADWAQSEDGCIVNAQLAGLAILRLAGRISRQHYRQSVCNLAKSSSVPTADFMLIAKGILEAARCMLAGSGQIPFTPDQWDAEGAAA
jgi:hypothetical protein